MYTFRSRIRYSETGDLNRLKLHSIVNYLQDCSTFQSEELGKGIDFLKRSGKVWLLNAWQIDIIDIEETRLGNEIEIGTWMYGYRGTLANRNFIINNSKGKRVVSADSSWVLCDLNTMSPIRIEESDTKDYPCEPKEDMEYLGRKISLNREYINIEEKSSVFVTGDMIDTNHHMNNASYVMVAENCIPKDIYISRIRVEYKKSAMRGDELKPVVKEYKEGYIIEIKSAKDDIFAVVEFTKKGDS